MRELSNLEEAEYEVVEEELHIKIRGETVRYIPRYKLVKVESVDQSDTPS